MTIFKSMAMTALFGLSLSSFASLNIHLANKTDSACSIESFQVIHGQLLNATPQQILSGDSKQFTIMGGVKGSEIDLTLKCGEKQITVHSQEDLGIIGQGAIHPKVLSADDGITATPVSTLGDFINESRLVWTLSDS